MSQDKNATPPAAPNETPNTATGAAPATSDKPKATPLAPEIGGPKGPEPTRYGDWQFNGRVTDF